MNEIVLQGPFLTRAEAARRAHVDRQLLPHRPDLLRLGGRWTEEVYFAFQFDDHGIRPDIGRVVTALRGHLADEVVADWLVRPNAHLAGAAPLTVLRGPHGLERVLRAARAEAPSQDQRSEPKAPQPEKTRISKPGPAGRAERPRRRVAFPHPA